MAVRPSPDRSDLESKTREDLQTIAKVKGVDVSARASKASLIEAIMGDPVPVSTSTEPVTRAVRSRRTVATPDDDFDDLLGEFVADAAVDRSETPPSTESITEETPLPVPSSNGSDRPAQNSRQSAQPRQDRQPRDFTNDTAGRNRRNRRNRNGRERFGGESMPNADQPYTGELIEIEGLLDLRDDGYGFLRTKSYHPSPNDVYVSINQVRRYHLRKGDTIVGGFRPAASNEKYPALLRVGQRGGHRPRGGTTASSLRGPHATLPRREAQPRAERGKRPTSRRALLICSRPSARASADSLSRHPRPVRRPL